MPARGETSLAGGLPPAGPETTINDTRDFGIGRALKNLPHLRRIGFQANRRLHGIVKRLPHSRRYGLTSFGLRTALFMVFS